MYFNVTDQTVISWKTKRTTKRPIICEFIHVSWGSGKTKYVPIPYIHGWIARVNMCCTSMSIWTIYMYLWPWSHLTHWGRVTHICIGNLTIIGSDNGLSPGRRQAIIWTNAGILSIGPLRNKLQWNFNRNSNIFIQKMYFKNSFAKWHQSCLGLNVLKTACGLFCWGGWPAIGWTTIENQWAFS